MTKNKELTSSEAETLQTEGVDTAIMESVNNDPDSITPTERALDNEAKEDAERILEIEDEDIEQQSTKHGVVLTGGIDSTVMLYQIKNTLPKGAKIIPIVLGDKGNVKKILSDAGIKAEIKSFNIDDSDADETKMLPVLEWAKKNKIHAIHFAANHNEAEQSIPNRNFDYFQRLNDLTDVNIATPFITVRKEDIIKMAVDLYDIDLSTTNEPQRKQKDKKVKEGYDSIRADGFKKAFSVKYQKWIEDPFAPKPKEEVKKA